MNDLLPTKPLTNETHRLWFREPATFWEEGLALGNGRIGAVVFGGTNREQILLNEETLYAGDPQEAPPLPSLQTIEEVRELIRKGSYAEADRLAERELYGFYTQPYQPMGNLWLEFEGIDKPTEYLRELDFSSASARVMFQAGGTQYRREVFVSHVHDALVIRLEAEGEGRLNFTLRISSELPAQIAWEGDVLTWEGQCPATRHCWGSNAAAEYRDDAGVRFASVLRINAENGRVAMEDDYLRVSESRAVTILLCARSSHTHPHYKAAAKLALESVAHCTYATLREKHLQDFRSLYESCELKLAAGSSAAELPTNERLLRASNGTADPLLDALLFHYGRYLLLSCSRRGTRPANLQGIWNPYVQPPWSCNYTMNINLQMNYWPADVTGLQECHEPLFDFIESLIPNGRVMARNYGCRGFCSHHQTDLTLQVHPRGKSPSGVTHEHTGRWAMWPMAAAWLSRHYWDHYEFTGDRAFLENRGWPVMREACEFLLDWLKEDKDGRLTTIPSSSPENLFVLPDGTSCSLSSGSTMDMAIIRDLFNCLLSTQKVLGKKEDSVADEIRSALPRLLPPRVGRLGQLQEWSEDWDRADDKHRHMSHFFGLHPGREITPETPELFQAARRSLELRGDEGTGWSRAWKISHWARLLDGDHAWRLLRQTQIFVQPTAELFFHNFQGGLYPNLFSACPPLQIDGNFGVTAGIAEMLLQSHLKADDGLPILHLLPAIPAAWPEGSVCGLRARGGFTLSLVWRAGALTRAEIAGVPHAAFHLQHGNRRQAVTLNADGRLEVDASFHSTPQGPASATLVK